MTAKLDASAVIYLSKAGLLDLAARCWGELVITSAVYEETVVAGRAAGYRDADVIAQAVEDRVVQTVSLGDTGRQRLVRAGFPSRLGHGEQETIIEAIEQGCLAVLDDLRARSAATVLGATSCRTETMLVEALAKAIIDIAQYEMAFLRLVEVKGMRPDDLAEYLRMGRLIREEMSHGRTDG